MAALKAHRQRQGLSQRALARRAGIAYKTVQLLEQGGHDARWSTLVKLARALGLPQPHVLLAGPRLGPSLTAAQAAASMRTEGEGSWKLRLFDFVDAFRRAPSRTLIAQAPPPDLSRRLLALLAATVEALCAERGLQAPWWSAGVPPLPRPWFTAGAESLKASALAESPAAFRQKNIFVLGNFLSRA